MEGLLEGKTKGKQDYSGPLVALARKAGKITYHDGLFAGVNQSERGF